MNLYCTIFDLNYLSRALALHASLVSASSRACLAFVCIDDRAADLLSELNLERAIVVRHDDFATDALVRTRQVRSRGEYCWSSKPVAMLYLMARFSDSDWVIYVDTDMMFFSDPDSVLPGNAAHYLLTPHRFHKAYICYAKDAGLHNAGYVAARNSVEGRQVIQWWQDRCLENCSSIPTATTYADQKYLDKVLSLFPCGESSSHIGLNAAPWNIGNYRLSMVGSRLLLDNQPLILYHFQGLQTFDDGTASLYIGNERLARPLKQFIYAPYMERLAEGYRTVRTIDSSFNDGLLRKPPLAGSYPSRMLAFLRRRKNLVGFPVSVR